MNERKRKVLEDLELERIEPVPPKPPKQQWTQLEIWEHVQTLKGWDKDADVE